MADPEVTTGRTAWARNLGAPVRSFLQAETAGAIVLVAAVLVALAWANSPWPASYDDLWSTDLSIHLGHHVLANDLRGWVNEGLMTLFFLVVGLEAKRELDLGELRERRRLEVPVVAALGGMALTAGIYLAVTAGGDGAGGWGAALSTDTALALGALTIVAPAGGTRLRVFLLTVVVVDDVVALIVIAVVYSDAIALGWLALAVALFGVLVALRFAGPWRGTAAVVVGALIWLALFESGIDPVVAGLAVGLITSAYPPSRDTLARATASARSFREQPTPALAYDARRTLTAAISANERLQFRLHPWTSFVVVPLFALANAGVHVDATLLRDAVTSPVTLGIVGGYVLGKPLGILGASWLATRPALGGARLPVTWPGLAGTGAAAGVGFTVSLLIADRAFDQPLRDQATLGVLASAVLSPLVAAAIFAATARLPATTRARQLSRTAEQLIDLAEEVDPRRDHLRGNPAAPVTLVEYGDFECPFCGRAEPVIRRLLTTEGDDLRYVFRHLPLSDVHVHAQLAAEAAEAAAAQGAFWPMHDRLLERQDALTADDLLDHAGQLGLDVERFTEDLRRHRHAERVAEDVASADASGVSGTPTFFINGRRHHGAYDIDTLTAAVAAAHRLARTAEAVAPAGGSPPDRP